MTNTDNTHCLNCSETHTDANYCPTCGQKLTPDPPFETHIYLHGGDSIDFIEHHTHLDFTSDNAQLGQTIKNTVSQVKLNLEIADGNTVNIVGVNDTPLKNE